MKKIVVILLCVLFTKAAWGQKGLLSFNEQHKYIYYQVAEKQGLAKDSLFNRAIYFLKQAYPKNSIQETGTPQSITGGGKFLLFSGISIAKHVDGEINYSFYLEYKDQKYRYWLTDFVFTPYKVDRYGNPVPQLGMAIPLEDGLSKLSKGQLDDYLNKTDAYCHQFGEKLILYMAKQQAQTPMPDKVKVISTKDW